MNSNHLATKMPIIHAHNSYLFLWHTECSFPNEILFSSKCHLVLFKTLEAREAWIPADHPIIIMERKRLVKINFSRKIFVFFSWFYWSSVAFTRRRNLNYTTLLSNYYLMACCELRERQSSRNFYGQNLKITYLFVNYNQESPRFRVACYSSSRKWE